VVARFSVPVQTGPGSYPAYCTMGTVSFPGVKSGQGVMLTPHPILVQWSGKSRTITLLPLWAVRPVQSLSACRRVLFTFTFNYTVNVVRRSNKCRISASKEIQKQEKSRILNLTARCALIFYLSCKRFNFLGKSLGLIVWRLYKMLKS